MDPSLVQSLQNTTYEKTYGQLIQNHSKIIKTYISIINNKYTWYNHYIHIKFSEFISTYFKEVDQNQPKISTFQAKLRIRNALLRDDHTLPSLQQMLAASLWSLTNGHEDGNLRQISWKLGLQDSMARSILDWTASETPLMACRPQPHRLTTWAMLLALIRKHGLMRRA